MSDDNLYKLTTRTRVRTTYDLLDLMERHCRITRTLVLDQPIDGNFDEMVGHMIAPLVQLVIAGDREAVLADFSAYGDVAAYFAESALYVLHTLRESEKP